MAKIQVFSEIGKLKSVILHHPGRELKNITPELMEEFLFDEVPYVNGAVAEHDEFGRVLRDNGVETLYLHDLIRESLEQDEVKEAFVDEFISESHIKSEKAVTILKKLLIEEVSTYEMVDYAMSGIRRTEFPAYPLETLVDHIEAVHPFITNPMPNLYFTRDVFSLIGSGVSMNHMWSPIRNRETLFGKYIFKYHPMFRDEDISFYYKRDYPYHIEGGDELILSDKVIAVGISQRSEAKGIEVFAENILKGNDGFETVLVFRIPLKRAFMHLDTVFTMIDKNVFTIHPEIEEPLEVYSITLTNGALKYTKEENTLKEILKKYLELDDVKLIPCGGGDYIDASSEQWSDGSNTFAIAPGEVVVYDRNVVTNELLEDNGVKLHIIPSAELSRGRGGPRCMTMPVVREKI